MWIVAVGWAYVVILMAATETSVIAGIMTFFGYCVLPLSILFYIAGAGKRRARRAGASPRSPSSHDGADANLPLMTHGFFLPASDNPTDCGSGSADNGGCDGGGGDGGGGGGD
ncbi:hypothetical protein [Massilia sp. YIM B02769]|uniref:hypothetical protein n=1 Tax=Massilia sp. YIM B02769 TaxID=3050129 RepID=UPI0025B6BA12|nr:hypothetical protein [Massilia sp. YIM B02769]